MVRVDLTSPLHTLVPSLDSAVLEVLAGTESGLSATTIAKLAPRGSRQGQYTVLTRLVHHGLVLADPSSTGALYRLNRDHVLAPAVLAAVGARQEILRRLTDAVVDLGHVECAAVYGSFARREAGVDSDVDLLLVIEQDADTDEWRSGLASVEDQFVSWTGNRLEPLVLTVDALARTVRAGEPLVQSWKQEALTVHGRELRTLVAELALGQTR